MEQAFKVGDRVECIDGYAMHPSGPYRGWTGTVRGFFNIYNPIVTWDGQGVRSADDDRCAEHRLRLIEASPSLEDRIAALEAEVKALKEGQGAQAEEPAQQTYAFGDPVEVRVDGEWREGMICAPKTQCDTYFAVYLDPNGFKGSTCDWFNTEDIRPRVK